MSFRKDGPPPSKKKANTANPDLIPLAKPAGKFNYLNPLSSEVPAIRLVGPEYDYRVKMYNDSAQAWNGMWDAYRYSMGGINKNYPALNSGDVHLSLYEANIIPDQHRIGGGDSGLPDSYGNQAMTISPTSGNANYYRLYYDQEGIKGKVFSAPYKTFKSDSIASAGHLRIYPHQLDVVSYNPSPHKNAIYDGTISSKAYIDQHGIPNYPNSPRAIWSRNDPDLIHHAYTLDENSPMFQDVLSKISSHPSQKNTEGTPWESIRYYSYNTGRSRTDYIDYSPGTYYTNYYKAPRQKILRGSEPPVKRMNPIGLESLSQLESIPQALSLRDNSLVPPAYNGWISQDVLRPIKGQQNYVGFLNGKGITYEDVETMGDENYKRLFPGSISRKKVLENMSMMKGTYTPKKSNPSFYPQ